jgi:hypothetical protein
MRTRPQTDHSSTFSPWNADDLSSSSLADLEFSYHSVGFHDGLGPWTIDSSSSLFTVAGAIFFSFQLASPPPTLRIYAFKAFFVQTHHITSFRDKTKTQTLVKKSPILERGWEGPYTNKALDRLKMKGKESDTVLFDGSRKETEGWMLEDVGRIVSWGFLPRCCCCCLANRGWCRH